LNDDETTSWTDATVSGGARRPAKPTVGTSQLRVEDKRLTTGAGCFVDDVPIADEAHLVFFRSPYACGKLTACDVSGALEVPGVMAAFTGADVASLGNLSVSKPFDFVTATDFPVLAQDAVLAVGQPVAAIVAETRNAAHDAAERILVDIDPADGFFDPLATPNDADLIGNTHHNIALQNHWSAGDVEAAFSVGAHTVEASIQHPRLAPSPMEPRAIAVDYDAATGQLTVWLSTQTPHRARKELAAILRIEADRVRVVAPDVGGAFGMKASLYPEDALVAWAALKLKRAVRWTASRGEDLLSATHGRGTLCEGELSVGKDGRFLALKAKVTCPLGYWLPTSAAIPAWNAARILPGPYDIDAVDISTRGILTNTAPVGIYRGAGRPEACALMERLVEEAAVATGLDAVKIRKINLLPAASLPHTGPTGKILDSGDYAAALDAMCERADYDALVQMCNARRRSGETVGIGISIYVEPCGRGWESAIVTLNPDGTVMAATGTSSQGHGRETAFAQIVADELDVPMSSVTIVHSDTDTAPEGIGALASRSTPIGGSALKQAAIELRARLPLNSNEPVTASVVYEADGEAWSYGCCLAVVSIDPETGELDVERIVVVDDAGPTINPMLVNGQIAGGIAQGLGESLLEQIQYDDDGQLLTGSFTDYAIPRADDVPMALDILKLHTPSPFNLIGAKGVGEAGTIGTPAAILNAAHDAVGAVGTRHLDPPLTSEKLWRTLQSATRGEIE
jgi:carbon-monoxide dehydrogenase large subunit